MVQPSFKSTSLVLALVLAGTAGGAAVQALDMRAHAQTAPLAAAMTPVAGAVRATTGVPDFSAITDSYGPAVVNITVSGTRKTTGPAAGTDPFEMFRRGMPGRVPGAEVPVRGAGSGFIVSDDGLILTNAHVVDGAQEVTVKLTDRREFAAKVLGADPRTDVAVLKIDAGAKLPTVKLGRVDSLRVGEWVLAIGSPFGLENTVTAGVVSAKARSLPSDSAVPFIQTDVAVNPGNSGGPLFNGAGEVVGINSQIYSRSGGYQGLSFAIPIDLALRVKDQIVSTGKVEHAKLGVSIQEVNQALANSFGLDRPTGALVADVESGSAADKAGLKTGDVVLKVDGKPVQSSADLPATVAQRAPGERLTLEVWRAGKPVQVTATLARAGNEAEAVQAKSGADASQGRLGLALAPAPGADGLVVQQATGAAARAGVEEGDVLLSVNGVPAKDVQQVREAVAKAGKSVALLLERDGQKRFVPVPLG